MSSPEQSDYSRLPEGVAMSLSRARDELAITDDQIDFWECSDYGIFVLLTERFYQTLKYRKADPADFCRRKAIDDLPFENSYSDSRVYMELILEHLDSFGLFPHIYDVGGYIGRFSIESALLVKRLGKKIPIHCLEPGLTGNIIRANLEVNQVTDLVELRPEAASSENSSATYRYAQDVLISGRICDFPSATRTKKVETVRLDHLSRSTGCNDSAIYKIDTEGHEPDVVSGLGSLVYSMPHVCIIEFWPKTLASTVNGSLYADFVEKNYIVLNIRSSLYPAHYSLVPDIREFASRFDYKAGNIDLLFISRSMPDAEKLSDKLQSLSP